MSPILVMLTSSSDSDFECLNTSFNETKLNGVDENSKASATREIFYSRWQFQEIIALPSEVQISVCSISCAGHTAFSEKLQKY